MNAYINSQFGYYPLVWMMYSRFINNKINRVYKRALMSVYKGKFSSFKNFLEKDEAVKIHVKNPQVLVTEMFKVKNGIAPKLISGIFKLSNPTHNMRNKGDFVSNRVKTVYFATKSLSYQGPKLWDLLTQQLKTLMSLTQFKSQVKK